MLVNEGMYSTLTINSLSESEVEMTVAMLSLLDVVAIEEGDGFIKVHDGESSKIKGVQSSILEMCSWLDRDQVTISQHQKENWNKKWEESFQPITIGAYCLVRATFHGEDDDADYQHVIVIDPEMAFGTGHHETTYLMMEQMRALQFDNASVFDFGCGTAILAILAEKLGAKKIYAIDNDPIAIECADQCLAINGSKSITTKTETIDLSPNSKYDIILANINRNILLNTGKDMLDRLVDGGVLLLSGILEVDEVIIENHYQNLGMQVTKKLQKGDWLCLRMERIA